MPPLDANRPTRPRANPLRCEQLEDRSLLCAPAAFPVELLDVPVSEGDVGADPALVDPAGEDGVFNTMMCTWTGEVPASASSGAWSSSSSAWSSGSSMLWTSAGSSSAVWTGSSGAGSSASLSGIAYLGGPLVASSGEPLIAYCGGAVVDGEPADGEAMLYTMLAPGEGGLDDGGDGWIRCGTEVPDEVLAADGVLADGEVIDDVPGDGTIPDEDLIFYTMSPDGDPVEVLPVSAPVNEAPAEPAAAPEAVEPGPNALPPELGTTDDEAGAAPVGAESPEDEAAATDPVLPADDTNTPVALEFALGATAANPVAIDALDLGGELPVD